MADYTERLQGAVVDRYRIERHLGESDVATVYLARVLSRRSGCALRCAPVWS